jgi:hypothetical protein
MDIARFAKTAIAAPDPSPLALRKAFGLRKAHPDVEVVKPRIAPQFAIAALDVWQSDPSSSRAS